MRSCGRTSYRTGAYLQAPIRFGLPHPGEASGIIDEQGAGDNRRDRNVIDSIAMAAACDGSLFIGVSLDISLQKASEAALAESREL